MVDGTDLDFRICFTFNNAEFMRPIKFRAWNTNTNEMISWEQMGDDHWDLWTEFRVCKTMMQYTGLKDKNGKEIYEGDLLKFFDKVIAVVVFQDLGGWSYKWIDETYIRVRQRNPEPFFHNIMLWEVAGNIYETPNLLE